MPKGSWGEMLANKRGGKISAVGGSLAIGDSLLLMFIWP